MSEHRDLAVAVLAAGKGKRMGNPDLAKVLTPLHEKPLLGYVLETARTLGAKRIAVIVGHQRETVAEYVVSVMPEARCVIQAEQLGTGHAVQQTDEVLAEHDDDVLILSGDVPLLSVETLQRLRDAHRASDATLTVLTTDVPDATGYGRIIRSDDGGLARIVEHKDASDEELAVNEINSGVYLVRTRDLFDSLALVQNANAQGEYYLTDIADILNRQGKTVRVFKTDDWHEVHGINRPEDLEQAASILSARSEA